jgi:NAD-dependent deacetylase
MSNIIDKVFLSKLAEAEKIVFFSGAGISAESGIPTFRGKEGLWNKFRPEELANFNAFINNPELVWEWYKYRQKIVKDSLPNPGHLAIAEFQKYFPEVTVITQNVDNLHRRAGSNKIYELHGNIERNYCIKCKEYNQDDLVLSSKIPLCKCGGLIRPDVVWFGEMLPEDQYSGAETAASESDIFFVVGTSAVVYPAASLVYVAKQMNAFLVEINIEETDISALADRSFIGKSGKILPELLEEIKAGIKP